MNLKQLSIKNFKCFDYSEATFSKLNIFTGSNSSGKSSMLNAILAVAQSGQHFPFRLSPNGKYVVMGDYYEFVSYHNSTKPIEICLVLREGKEIVELRTTWSNDESTNMPLISTLEANSDYIELSISKNQNYQVHINFDEEKYKKSESYKSSQILESFVNEITGGELYKDLKERYRNIVVKTSHNTIDFQVDDLDNISAVLMKSDRQLVDYALLPIASAIKKFDLRFNFISCFRMKPERTYTQRSQSEIVKPNGENTIDQVFQWKVKKSPKFRELVKELRDLQLMNTLAINKFRGGRYEVRVKAKTRGAWASLVDVGFGISQFLPVIVADLQLPKDSTLIIDQPEIHLHPSAQARLADYFVRQIKNKSKNYFIETHSEYILNRLRASIVKGLVPSSAVKVFYFDNHIGETNIHEIKFTKSGKILGAPQGFFDTYMIDVMDIAISAAKVK